MNKHAKNVMVAAGGITLGAGLVFGVSRFYPQQAPQDTNQPTDNRIDTITDPHAIDTKAMDEALRSLNVLGRKSNLFGSSMSKLWPKTVMTESEALYCRKEFLETADKWLVALSNSDSQEHARIGDGDFDVMVKEMLIYYVANLSLERFSRSLLDPFDPTDYNVALLRRLVDIYAADYPEDEAFAAWKVQLDAVNLDALASIEYHNPNRVISSGPVARSLDVAQITAQGHAHYSELVERTKVCFDALLGLSQLDEDSPFRSLEFIRRQAEGVLYEFTWNSEFGGGDLTSKMREEVLASEVNASKVNNILDAYLTLGEQYLEEYAPIDEGIGGADGSWPQYLGLHLGHNRDYAYYFEQHPDEELVRRSNDFDDTLERMQREAWERVEERYSPKSREIPEIPEIPSY